MENKDVINEVKKICGSYYYNKNNANHYYICILNTVKENEENVFFVNNYDVIKYLIEEKIISYCVNSKDINKPTLNNILVLLKPKCFLVRFNEEMVVKFLSDHGIKNLFIKNQSEIWKNNFTFNEKIRTLLLPPYGKLHFSKNNYRKQNKSAKLVSLLVKGGNEGVDCFEIKKVLNIDNKTIDSMKIQINERLIKNITKAIVRIINMPSKVRKRIKLSVIPNII